MPTRHRGNQGNRRGQASTYFRALVAALLFALSTASPAFAGEAVAVPAKAWLIADLTSGAILASNNQHLPLAPASTLKTLTALTLMPKLAPDATYVATEADLEVDGGTTGMQVGMTYTVRDLWHGLLLDSGNDTAMGLAHAYSPTTTDTLNLMRQELVRLGARDTVVKNPHGLDAKGQVSSVFDMALFARAALNIPFFRTVDTTPTYRFPAKQGSFQIQNENRLLGKYKGVIGGKTGYTSNAGQTYWVAAQRGDVALIAVLFGIDGRMDKAAKNLLDWGFRNHATVNPVGTLPDPVTPTVTKAPTSAVSATGALPWRREINWAVVAIVTPVFLLGLLLTPGRKSDQVTRNPIDLDETA